MKRLLAISLLFVLGLDLTAQNAVESQADKTGKETLVQRLVTSNSYLYGQILDKCFSFRLSPGCWATFSDPANDGQTAGY